jgi:hypothetical protein
MIRHIVSGLWSQPGYISGLQQTAEISVGREFWFFKTILNLFLNALDGNWFVVEAILHIRQTVSSGELFLLTTFMIIFFWDTLDALGGNSHFESHCKYQLK